MLSDQATRSKVKDILSIEIRKLQTEVSRLLEVEASSVQEASKVVKPESKVAASKGSHTYTVEVKTYG